MSELLIGVGQSSQEDSFLAGKEAAAEALNKHGENPEVLIIFGSARFDYRQLVEGIISAAGDLPMVGGTTAGEISTSGFSTQSVVIMALSSEELSFVTGIGKDMSKSETACSMSLIKSMRKKKSQRL